MSKDYYKILGVNKNASQEEIKQAFRRLAQQHHPDKGGEEKKFKEINEAYSVLSDDNKRQQYDQFGATFETFQGRPFGEWQDFNWGDIFSFFGQDYSQPKGFYSRRINLEDLFSDFFGNIFGGRGTVLEMEISLKDALNGIVKEIKLDDHNIKLKIKVRPPKDLSDKEKELLEKLKKERL
jgi:DnaJ-class molecular chaperone